MSKEKKKVYLYTRVSTIMQIDGYSLDAQQAKMKAFCEYNDYEIAGMYEDAGKSGKSIDGRPAFRWRILNPEKMTFHMCLFLSCPDLAEMLQMFYLHFN